jgi:hypothetical protein
MGGQGSVIRKEAQLPLLSSEMLAAASFGAGMLFSEG